MATYIVPNRRNAPNPLDVIDPVDGRVDPATGMPLPGVKDSSAGIQRFIDSCPSGSNIVQPFGLVASAGFVVWGRKKYIAFNDDACVYAPVTYPWRPQPDLRAKLANGAPNPWFNPDGICAPWLFDVTGKIDNPYCRKGPDGKPNVNGGAFGGYDGTTGASGVDYDGKHLSTRLTSPFLAKHKGMAIRVLPTPNEADFNFNQIIVAVPDAKTVRFNDPAGVARAESSTHTVAWAIQPKKGWGCIFLPNPAWQAEYWGDDWKAFDKALDRAVRKCRGRTIISVRDTSEVIGVEVFGPNVKWQHPIINFEASRPLVNEFQHGIEVESGTAVSDGCYSHHQWGDGFGGPGVVKNFVVDSVGRQGMVGHYSGKIIKTGIIARTRRAAIDFETSKEVHNALVSDVVLGANNGISSHAPLIDCVFEDIRSTQADIDAGLIDALCPSLDRGKEHGAPGSRNVTYRRIEFDAEADNFLVAAHIDGLHVHECRQPIRPTGGDGEGYFVKPWSADNKSNRCKNVDVSGNDGGPQCLGQVAP